MTEVIEADSLHRHLFEGADHGGIPVSFFVIQRLEAGGGPRLHAHPYAEVFVVHDGEATFTVGDETIVAVAGQIVVAPRERPHKFTNTGSGSLRMTNIHPNERVIVEYFNE